PREQHRDDNPQNRSHDAAGRDPAPFGLVAARAEAIEDGESKHDADQEKRPSGDGEDPFRLRAEPDEVEDDRKNDDRDERGQNEENGSEGEGEGQQVQRDEAPLLLLVIDDVEGIEDGLHAGIGAPQRQPQAEDKAEAESAAALGGDADHLLADDVDAAAGQDAG